MTEGVSEEPLGVIRLGRFGRVPWLPFESLIALLMVNVGVRNLVDPLRTSVPGAPQSVSTFISVVYVLGGVCMFLGLLRTWVRVEMFGLLCLIVAITTSTGLIIHYRGPSVLAELVTFIGTALFSGIRLYELSRHRDVVQIEVPHGRR